MTSNEFSEIFRRYSDEILRFSLSRVKSRDVAKDLVQETFINFWNYVKTGKKIEEPRAFLYTTARNKIIDYYRKNKSLSLDERKERGFDTVDESMIRPEIQAEANFAIKLINSLDKKYRDVLYLKLVEEMTTREISKILGITESNTSIRIVRGMKKIKTKLNEKHE